MNLYLIGTRECRAYLLTRRIDEAACTRHAFTISVRYFGSSASMSLPLSACSSLVGLGCGDVRLSTGMPTAMKNSSCPAGVHMHSMWAVVPDTFLKACGALAGTL